MVVIPIDFPNPAIPGRAVDLLTWLQPTPLNLRGKDQVFGGAGQPAPAYDWPNPIPYTPAIELRTFLQTLPLNLRGKDKVFGGAGQPAPAYDYPNPQLPRPSIDLLTWAEGVNLELYFQPTAPIPALAFSADKAAYSASASDTPSGQGWKGQGFMTKYEIDTQIQISGVFTNALSGVYIDPSLITLFILDPAGVTTSVSGGQIIKDSQGHYHYTITPAKSGTWTYKWRATGSAVATSPDTVFTVNASSLIAG